MRREGAADRPAVTGDPLTRVVVAVAGLALVAFGLWAFLGPASFSHRVASFPPFNRHLTHDLGAFMTGLGAALLLALVWSDALLVVLGGNAVAAILRLVSHLEDRHLGGRSADPVLFGMVAAIFAVLTGLQWARVRR